MNNYCIFSHLCFWGDLVASASFIPAEEENKLLRPAEREMEKVREGMRERERERGKKVESISRLATIPPSGYFSAGTRYVEAARF